MAHPKFKETCRYCLKGGLCWTEKDGRWVLLERNNRSGATRPHECPKSPWAKRTPPPPGPTAIRTAPVPGVEYVTAKLQREILEAQFFEYMDNRGDPGDWDEYLASNIPGEQIEGQVVVEDSTPQWIV
ncbi:hypothetical protein JT326_gp40 [Aeromonas phage vB_AhyS-A18P4]|uniref:Uncharacterized protein n=1 Tax=Aeromonas phage vB_AhyS-A18P4 TaxID=2608321 RepID=A0A5J6T2S5_9CAUD|nr:hypothetical protein JT326_gp40 [Aeromonas phage vB_AhyS-A18P4]QFG04443.1 hypothetical protein [Aeromonas phage vB_AhyS-A18P4]